MRIQKRRTRRGAPTLALITVAGILALGMAGCAWPWRKQQDKAKSPLGINDERIKEVDVKALDAEQARPQSGLRLVIQADKGAYAINEPIVVEVRLENVMTPQGAQPPRDIPVYFEPVAQARDGTPIEWLFRFQLLSEKDDRVVYQSPDVNVSEADRANYYHYVTLSPQSYVGRRFVFWPARARGLLTPGRYSLRASYAVSDDYPYVILNRHFTAAQVELLGTKLAYVHVWTGQLYSNRIEFAIKRKKVLGLF